MSDTGNNPTPSGGTGGKPGISVEQGAQAIEALLAGPDEGQPARDEAIDAQPAKRRRKRTRGKKRAMPPVQAAEAEVVDEAAQVDEYDYSRSGVEGSIDQGEPDDAEAEELEADEESDELDILDDEIGEGDEDEGEGYEPEIVSDPETVVQLADGSQMPLGELVKGRMLQEDYTRKTTELSQLRQQAVMRDRALSEQLTYVQQQGEMMLERMMRDMPQRPSAELAASDPFKYQAERARYDERQGEIQQFQHDVQQMHQRLMEQQEQTKAQAFMQNRNLLMSRRPDLQDPQKAEAMTKLMHQTLRQFGYQESEFQAILTDYRTFDVLEAAARHLHSKRSVKKARKRVHGKSPMRSTGRVDANAAARRRENAKKARLKRTGRVEDAAAVLYDRLG